MRRLAVILALAAAASSCMVLPPGATVSLRVKGFPADATVTIDDIAVGTLAHVASRGVALPQGQHRITVERNGFFPWDKIVDAELQPIQLDITLVAIPD